MASLDIPTEKHPVDLTLDDNDDSDKDFDE